ncbi:MAG: protein-L-isoaspartate O-methyltransferase [Candidatus Saccharibacteria bacterium]
MNRFDEVFKAVPRINFLRPETKAQHDVDTPLPIGYGQTNSQPSTVRLMLQWLDPQPTEKVLEVGSGSGWTVALLAHLVGPTGTVYAVERIPELLKYGKDNCKNVNIHNALFFEAGPAFGLPDYEPYDRILVSAAATRLPKILFDQLALGGKLVIPTNTTIHVIEKIDTQSYKQKQYPGFLFVPLIRGKSPTGH